LGIKKLVANVGMCRCYFGFFAALKREFRMFDPIAIGFGFVKSADVQMKNVRVINFMMRNEKS